MGMNLGRFGGYYPMNNRPFQIGQINNTGPKISLSANHDYEHVDDLINDLNDGKFKKGDKVTLKRENYTETYEVLGNGRLKRC